MKKVVVTNVFGYDNRGDAALVEVLFAQLQAEFGSVTGLARNPKGQAAHLPGFTWYESIGRSSARNVLQRRVGNLGFSLIALLFATLRINPKWAPLPDAQKQSMMAIRDADIVVSCAGGFLHDANLSLYTSLLQIFIAKAYGVPYIFAPQTIGPFKGKLARACAKYILDSSERIFSREGITTQYLYGSMKIDPQKVEFFPDLALFHKDTDHAGADAVLGEFGLTRGGYVALTALDWEFPFAQSRHSAQTLYEEKLVQLIDMIGEKYELPILIMNQVSTDLPVAVRIRDRASVKVIVDTIDRTPAMMRGLISGSKAVVASRFHSCVFAMLEGVPVQAISYNYKTDGIMETLGLSSRVHSIDDFAVADIFLNISRDIESGVSAVDLDTQTREFREDGFGRRARRIVEGLNR